jgi:hypothetical protein
MILRSLNMVLIAAAMLAPAKAQTVPAPDDIVVTGNKEADRKAAEAYVASIAVRSESQLARFHQPVCPLVIGMPKPYSTMIEKRIAEDAVAAGIDVAKKARCDANLIIVIADDGAALVKDIRIHYPGWLAGLSPHDIDVLTVPAPARAWSVTSLRNEDGQGLGNQPDTPSGDGLAGKPVLRVMTASILREPTRQDMEASFVMIDKAATMGLTLRQIADYAAMRGLARTRPPVAGGGGLTTILAIFDPSAPSRARELTNADAAYLRALYRGNGTAAAVNEKNDIARRIAKGK